MTLGWKSNRTSIFDKRKRLSSFTSSNCKIFSKGFHSHIEEFCLFCITKHGFTASGNNHFCLFVCICFRFTSKGLSNKPQTAILQVLKLYYLPLQLKISHFYSLFFLFFHLFHIDFSVLFFSAFTLPSVLVKSHFFRYLIKSPRFDLHFPLAFLPLNQFCSLFFWRLETRSLSEVTGA